MSLKHPRATSPTWKDSSILDTRECKAESVQWKSNQNFLPDVQAQQSLQRLLNKGRETDRPEILCNTVRRFTRLRYERHFHLFPFRRNAAKSQGTSQHLTLDLYGLNFPIVLLSLSTVIIRMARDQSSSVGGEGSGSVVPSFFSLNPGFYGFWRNLEFLL